jgi:hypothetical protein
LQREDVKPEIIVLEECEDDDLDFWEIWHIAYWKGLGCRLTNATAGGEGTKGVKWTPAMYKLHSERWMGNTFRKGVKLSQETKDKVSKSLDRNPRRVICVSTGEVFPSNYDVLKKYGMVKSNLIRHLKMKNPQRGIGGLVFRFADEFDPEKDKPFGSHIIIVHDDNGNFVNEYPSQKACIKALNLLKKTSLTPYLEGERQGLSYRGYHFSYKR